MDCGGTSCHDVERQVSVNGIKRGCACVNIWPPDRHMGLHDDATAGVLNEGMRRGVAEERQFGGIVVTDGDVGGGCGGGREKRKTERLGAATHICAAPLRCRAHGFAGC